ncbi:MAG: DUF3830 family protein [Cypionkella sp.]
MTKLRIQSAASGLDVTADFLEAKAPQNGAFLRRYLASPRVVPGIHAMWTGPEISCPVPPAHLVGADYPALPAENATIHPQPGDVVLAYVPARMWGGSPDPVFDIGLFYGPGARLLFPIGWLAGSVVARVHDVAALAEACGRIRRSGACDVTFSLEA